MLINKNNKVSGLLLISVSVLVLLVSILIQEIISEQILQTRLKKNHFDNILVENAAQSSLENYLNFSNIDDNLLNKLWTNPKLKQSFCFDYMGYFLSYDNNNCNTKLFDTNISIGVNIKLNWKTDNNNNRVTYLENSSSSIIQWYVLYINIDTFIEHNIERSLIYEIAVKRNADDTFEYRVLKRY